MTYNDNIITFSSGHEEYVHRGIVGLDHNGNIFHGYDGEVHSIVGVPELPHISIDDRIELAIEMKRRWEQVLTDAVNDRRESCNNPWQCFSDAKYIGIIDGLPTWETQYLAAGTWFTDKKHVLISAIRSEQ